MTTQRRETLGEWREQKMREGRVYVAKTLPELWALEAQGDQEATKELAARDAAYAALGQG